jgi:hypothetical protein
MVICKPYNPKYIIHSKGQKIGYNCICIWKDIFAESNLNLVAYFSSEKRVPPMVPVTSLIEILLLQRQLLYRV